jgi:hypothetical protein
MGQFGIGQPDGTMIDQRFLRPADMAAIVDTARTAGLSMPDPAVAGGEVRALPLRMTARAIAASSGKKGAIVITLDANGIHVASDGLNPEEVREALCTAIHASFLFNDER